MILALDPGINGCGAALFTIDGELARAAYVRSPASRADLLGARVAEMALALERWVSGAEKIDRVVAEVPQVYAGSKQKGDPNDLIVLAAVVGVVAGRFLPASVVLVAPRDWKGQLPPNPCARRILSRLSEREAEAVDGMARFRADLSRAEAANREIGGIDHNTLDAVGIGLHHVGRFASRRAFAEG